MTTPPDVARQPDASSAVADDDRGGRQGLVLAAEELRVVHDGRAAVDGVTLEVRPGQVLAVTGPSGAGKTTLLWALAGLHPPDSGTVRLTRADGAPVDVTTDSPRDAYARAGVVIVPQGNALATVLTATENVVVPLLAAGVPADHAHGLAATTLDEVGLATSGTQLVEELSGGQQQRVAVARGLAQRGTVVLADEPTSELDAVNRARVVALLRAEADRGATVVMATHDPQAAEACDGELHLDDGVPTWVRPLGLGTDQPVTEQPTTEQPTTEQPTTEQPTTEQPDGDVPPRGRHRLG
jgi:putative ABC transport system ATP-binding protein